MIVYGILMYVRGLLFHFVVVTCAFVKAKQKRVTEINNNYLLRWRWLVTNYRAARRQGIYTPLATNAEVNNCFSIFKNIEIIEHKKRWFLTHLLPTIQTILARK